MKRDLYIIGTGGVGRLAQQIAKDQNQQSNTRLWNVKGFFDDLAAVGDEIHGIPVRGSVSDLFSESQGYVIVCVGDPSIRSNLVAEIEQTHHNFATLIHPFSWIGDNVEIGCGSIVYPGCMIDVDVTIGSHVQIHSGTTVGHDSIINDTVTFSPGVNLAGNVDVGEIVYFGINSATIQGLTIGRKVTVGAGATVIEDIESDNTVVGTPATPID